MPQLLDYSLILISLAILGFILKDNFYKYRVVPYELKTSTDKYFSYISLSLFVTSYFWFFIMILLSGDSELVSPLLENLNKFEMLIEAGIISEVELIESIKDFVLFYIAFTFFSIFFILIYSITSFLGLINLFFDVQGIEVSFKDKNQNRIYRRIIAESNDFYYLETIDDFRNWEAVKKEDVLCIKNIIAKSKFDRIVINSSKDFDVNHPFLFSNSKQIVLATFFVFLVIGFIITLIPNIKIFEYLFILSTFMVLILMLINNSLKKK